MLANLSGFDGSPESLRKLQLEYGAEIARAVVNFKGPFLFQVVSRYHGGAYVVFSQELNDSLRAFALTGSYASVIGGGPAAKVVFSRDVRVRALADPRVKECERALRANPSMRAREALEKVLADVTLEKQAEVADEFDQIHSVERAQKGGARCRASLSPSRCGQSSSRSSAACSPRRARSAERSMSDRNPEWQPCDEITLEGVEVPAALGVSAAERRMRRPVSLDLSIGLDLSRSGASDKLAHTIDYQAIYDVVAEVAGAVSTNSSRPWESESPKPSSSASRSPG